MGGSFQMRWGEGKCWPEHNRLLYCTSRAHLLIIIFAAPCLFCVFTWVLCCHHHGFRNTRVWITGSAVTSEQIMTCHCDGRVVKDFYLCITESAKEQLWQRQDAGSRQLRNADITKYTWYQNCFFCGYDRQTLKNKSTKEKESGVTWMSFFSVQ